MRKNKIVLFGAYDRYNYGDNLMPIVFLDYMKKYHPDLVAQSEFVYSSIMASDLSRYQAPKTIPIDDVCPSLSNQDALIVVGGEVLCASNSTLFLHMPRNKTLNDLLTKLNRRPVFRDLLHLYARHRCPIPWDFPYVPDPDKLPAGLKIVYHTVGGHLNDLGPAKRQEITGRLNRSAILAVRDNRTKDHLAGIPTTLAPDSVHIISDLYDDTFFAEHAEKMYRTYRNERYFCFQASPQKMPEDIQSVAQVLRDICQKNGCKVMLLPIGYAAGHDDAFLLRELQSLIPEVAFFEDELTLWEIMFLIKNSLLYIGTSLHGAITALSYGIPHFGLNKKIVKLNDFLGDWSVAPFNQNYDMQTIGELAADLSALPSEALTARAKLNNQLVRQHFDSVATLLGQGGD
ncbi:polysaccharide pyruvyl transferase family protein [Pseudaeromonas sp. ZJS20]|uniref:polysaccharide pyruvyl transferase family protein n=1 Tax=Pseudaeromonas aegiceratis TaxID=3153928 RepID=UPI00390C896D